MTREFGWKISRKAPLQKIKFLFVLISTLLRITKMKPFG